MRRLALAIAIIGCHGDRPVGHVDAAVDTPADVSPADAAFPRDGGAPSGWGSPCARDTYGAFSCLNGNVRGWCVTFHGSDVCMPGCQAPNYSCPSGQFPEYFEGSECFCVME